MAATQPNSSHASHRRNARSDGAGPWGLESGRFDASSASRTGRRRRIAWFAHRYFPCIGGSENYCRAIVSRYVAAGYDVDVFTSDAHDLWYFTDGSRRQIDAPRVSEVDGARVERFPIRHVPLQRYLGRLLSYVPHWPTRCRYASYMPIIPGLDRIRGAYDAVFGVGFPFTIFSHAAFKTARASGAPLILTPFLHLATPGDAVNRHYTRPHQVRLLAEADCVVVQTALEADAVVEWGIPRERVQILGMAVEHREVTGGTRSSFRAQLGLDDTTPLIGHLATLDPNKGSTDLILAVERINQKRAREPIHLVLAGSSSPCFERFLASYPGGKPSWLHLSGPMPAIGRPDFYAALDLFAMPSRTDSFGIVFLEAWANGLAVVAAAAGGVPDVVTDGRNGRLVPFGDLAQLACALETLITDRTTAKAFGENGRALVASGYTWDDKFALLEGRTSSLIAQRHATRTT